MQKIDHESQKMYKMGQNWPILRKKSLKLIKNRGKIDIDRKIVQLIEFHENMLKNEWKLTKIAENPVESHRKFGKNLTKIGKNSKTWEKL